MPIPFSKKPSLQTTTRHVNSLSRNECGRQHTPVGINSTGNGVAVPRRGRDRRTVVGIEETNFPLVERREAPTRITQETFKANLLSINNTVHIYELCYQNYNEMISLVHSIHHPTARAFTTSKRIPWKVTAGFRDTVPRFHDAGPALAICSYNQNRNLRPNHITSTTR